jgi:hypothetical protein
MELCSFLFLPFFITFHSLSSASWVFLFFPPSPVSFSECRPSHSVILLNACVRTRSLFSSGATYCKAHKHLTALLANERSPKKRSLLLLRSNVTRFSYSKWCVNADLVLLTKSHKLGKCFCKHFCWLHELRGDFQHSSSSRFDFIITTKKFRLLRG